MEIVDFTPVTGLLGGLLIGAAAALMLWLNGLITGISGIVDAVLARPSRENALRWLFLAGLLTGAALEFWLLPADRVVHTGLPLPVFLLAGLLVGYGTRLGSGCTSGHGVCGVARLSGRSIAAVLTFVATGAATVFLVRHVLGVAS